MPILIGRVLKVIIYGMRGNNAKATLLAFVVTVLSLGGLPTGAVITAAVQGHTDTSVAPISPRLLPSLLGSAIGTLGRSLAQVQESYTNIANGSTLDIKGTIGADGSPLSSSVVDAHSLKQGEGTIYSAFNELLVLFQLTTLKVDYNNTVRLPYMKPLNILSLWLPTLNVDQSRGVVGEVAVNVWVSSLFSPLAKVLFEMVSKSPSFRFSSSVVGSGPTLGSEAERISALKGTGVLSFNVGSSLSVSVDVFVALIKYILNIDVSKSLARIICPIDPVAPEQHRIMLRSMPNFNVIITSLVALLLHGLSTQEGHKAEESFYFDERGNFIIIGAMVGHFNSLMKELGMNLSGNFVSSEADEENCLLVASSPDFVYFAGHLLTGLSAGYIHVMLRGGASAQEFLNRVPDLAPYKENPGLFWAILSPFMTLSTRKFLLFLNILPSSMSGLPLTSVPAGYGDFTLAALLKAAGLVYKDLLTLFGFVLISALLSKLDSVLRLTGSLTECFQS